ncbi:MAG: hypothetical protein JSR33_00965 [Proteobacteria bacterium]|nr:hypothetical protein [Pseudomonadota bacterium]
MMTLKLNLSIRGIFMALLAPQQKSKKIPISLRFDELLLTQIKSYNEWAGIERIDHFIEQAARFVLEKDKDWQKKSEKFSSGETQNQS